MNLINYLPPTPSTWLLSVTRSLICFRSLKSPISTLNMDTGFLGFFSRLIMILTNMNINFFCATIKSDEPRILKDGFQCIKTVMYAIFFQDLIWSFTLGYLKNYRHVLVNNMTSNTKNQAESWSIMHTIQWILIPCLLRSVILGWSNMNAESWGQYHSPYQNLTVGCDFDVTAISISWNNCLWQLGSLCQLPQLYNKKVTNIFMFMRCVLTTVQDLEA